MEWKRDLSPAAPIALRIGTIEWGHTICMSIEESVSALHRHRRHLEGAQRAGGRCGVYIPPASLLVDILRCCLSLWPNVRSESEPVLLPQAAVHSQELLQVTTRILTRKALGTLLILFPSASRCSIHTQGLLESMRAGQRYPRTQLLKCIYWKAKVLGNICVCFKQIFNRYFPKNGRSRVIE